MSLDKYVVTSCTKKSAVKTPIRLESSSTETDAVMPIIPSWNSYGSLQTTRPWAATALRYQSLVLGSEPDVANEPKLVRRPSSPTRYSDGAPFSTRGSDRLITTLPSSRRRAPMKRPL